MTNQVSDMKKGQRERAKGAHRVVAINGLQNSGTEGGVLEIKKQEKNLQKKKKKKKREFHRLQ